MPFIQNVSFNTQPPEGGWDIKAGDWGDAASFNTQPPEGGWGCRHAWLRLYWLFQHTAARRRLAGYFNHDLWGGANVSTHSRPKAAGCPDI